MKWYNFIVPCVAIYFCLSGNLWSGVVVLLLFPMFWLHPIIEKFIGKDPDLEKYLSSKKVRDETNMTTPEPGTPRMKLLNFVTGFCWITLFALAVSMEKHF
jgi:hypothetical protein